jgi:hypothetical protein
VTTLQRLRKHQHTPLSKVGLSNAIAYFNWLLIEASLSARLMPRALTSAIMASAMAAAIRQYSMAWRRIH